MPVLETTPEIADLLSELPLTEESMKQLANPLFQAILKSTVIPLRSDRFEMIIPAVIKDETERIVAGYASVILVDKQGDLIPAETLKEAWDQFSKSPEFMVSQVMHSNIPIGKVLLDYTSPSSGEHFHSGVDKTGLFVIVKIRSDIKKSDEVWMLVKSGDLKAFSIGGEALHRSIVCDEKCYTRIDKLELHEISIVTKPANQGAYFAIIKSDNTEFVKLEDVFKKLPEGMILIKDFINLVGSTVEKGVGHDFDFQVRENLQSDFLNRALRVRFTKLLGDKSHIFLGDPQGPHDTYIPIYDLCIIKRENPQPVSMSMAGHPVLKSETLQSISLVLKATGDNVKLMKILTKLRSLNTEFSTLESKDWSDAAREAALAARQAKTDLAPRVKGMNRKEIQAEWSKNAETWTAGRDKIISIARSKGMTDAQIFSRGDAGIPSLGLKLGQKETYVAMQVAEAKQQVLSTEVGRREEAAASR